MGAVNISVTGRIKSGKTFVTDVILKALEAAGIPVHKHTLSPGDIEETVEESKQNFTGPVTVIDGIIGTNFDVMNDPFTPPRRSALMPVMGVAPCPTPKEVALVVTGQTASGKSAVGFSIAKLLEAHGIQVEYDPAEELQFLPDAESHLAVLAKAGLKVKIYEVNQPRKVPTTGDLT